MTDVEIVIPRFGHYVNLASTVGVVLGGLGSDPNPNKENKEIRIKEVLISPLTSLGVFSLLSFWTHY